MTRKAISKKRRFEVFKRDRFTCQYCGAHPPAVILHVDHIHPVALGGSSDMGNLITSCQPCNSGKSATPLTSIPASLAEQAKAVAEREEQISGYRKVMEASKERREAEAWEVVDIFIDHFRKDDFRKDWFASVERFVESIGVVAVIDAMEISVCRFPGSEGRSFRYFCGICWNLAKEKAA